MTTTSKKTEPTAAHTGSNISKITISSDTRRLSPEDPPIFLRDREGGLIAGIKLEKQEVTNNAIRLTGWSLGSSGLALLRDGKEVDAEILRFSRYDVLEAYSVTSDIESGYEITIEYPEEGTYSLRWYFANSGKITHDDFDLGIMITAVSDLDIKRKQKIIASPQILNKLSDSNIIHAHIEEINNFYIRGWCLCLIEEHSPEAMVLRIGQSEYPVQPVIRERKDVSEQFSINEDKVGFEMHLPGYIWDGIPESNDLEIEILAEGYVLTKMPLIVTRKVAAQWIEQIFYQSENQNQQFFGLVALEHIRFGCLMPMLSAEVQAAVKLFTAKMNLGDYLPEVEETDKDVPAESFVTLMHWKALRQLNELLTDATTPQTVFQAVIDVMDRLGLSGEVRDRYLDSVVPTLCKYDIYRRLRDVTDIHRWHNYDHASDAWSLTVALPALVVSGHIERAINLLWKLTNHLETGWINTECIHFAVRELDRRCRVGLIDFQLAQRFRYAVIGVLDAFRGEWFSRLRDLELVQAAVVLLSPWPSYTDYFRRDLVKSLVRNYGLSPEFWYLLHEQHPQLNDNELMRAGKYWDGLKQTFDSSGPVIQNLESLVEPIRYFRQMGNPEATIFLREVVVNALFVLNDKLTSAGRMLISMLLEDPAEGVRLAAFPLAKENQLQHEFPEMKERLIQTLRELSPRPRSMFYEAQRTAARLARAVTDALDQDDDSSLQRALDALQNHALNLNDWENGFLGADLLGYCCECRLGKDMQVENLLLFLEKIINKAIEETKVDYFLPPPVQSALMRLVQYSAKSQLLRVFLENIRVAVNAKFGNKYIDIFNNSPELQYSIPATGYPRDTLVIIYSCRRYLGTRIEAIRATWVQDLKVRGIPYLILVGDGDDTVQGDILALDVSDKYEDLPKKTLKLFDWVLKYTDFQYVYKIDDDCYLSVDQFIDSLTYRKHFYYGRVIQRGVGSMDRAWHQSKSHTEHARKTIDKSPEPSTYADGGGGYVLSRLAMAKLQEAARSEKGQRLIACSLMEDKLVGDLLAVNGVLPNNGDYESYQRRRTFSEAIPVGMWENTFFPTTDTPIVMAHMDTDRDHVLVRELQNIGGLWPKRVWPTFNSILINAKWSQNGMIGTNQLELLSTSMRLQSIVSEPFAVIGVVRNEMLMLSHFLNHYRRLGVRAFFLVDNVSDDGTREYLLEQPDVALFSADTEYRYSHYGVAWQQAILGNFCMGKWVLLADADELLIYPNCENTSIEDYLTVLEADNIDAVRVNMIDMYPFGDLGGADFSCQQPFTSAPWMDRKPLQPWRLGSGYYSNIMSCTSALRHRLLLNSEPVAFVSQKFALLRYRPWVRLSIGLHYTQGQMNVSTRPVWFAHFKYHAGFKAKVEAEVRRNQHFDNAKEYRRYLEILTESRGSFGDERLSQRYESSESFMNLKF